MRYSPPNLRVKPEIIAAVAKYFALLTIRAADLVAEIVELAGIQNFVLKTALDLAIKPYTTFEYWNWQTEADRALFSILQLVSQFGDNHHNLKQFAIYLQMALENYTHNHLQALHKAREGALQLHLAPGYTAKCGITSMLGTTAPLLLEILHEEMDRLKGEA